VTKFLVFSWFFSEFVSFSFSGHFSVSGGFSAGTFPEISFEEGTVSGFEASGFFEFPLLESVLTFSSWIVFLLFFGFLDVRIVGGI